MMIGVFYADKASESRLQILSIGFSSFLLIANS